MEKHNVSSFMKGLAVGVALVASSCVVWNLTREDASRSNEAQAKLVKVQTTTVAPVKTASAKEYPGASDQWEKAFDASWIDAEKERHHIKPIANNKSVLSAVETQKEGQTYGNYTENDVLLWEKETERLVVQGSLIFHNADLLGSTNGTSCDMCHPDAEGTHAETYPKYQVQLGRVALLRDMANWCLTQPCRGKALGGDDPRMRALEAYMQAQRSGQPMKYGKH